MSHTPLSKEARILVQRIFAPEHRDEVVNLLEEKCGFGLSSGVPSGETLERIQFAVLKLSQGSVAELVYKIKLANVDWRDLLIAAEFANDLLAHRVWFRGVADA